MITSRNPAATDSPEEIAEKVRCYVLGKAYIAVLKHQLANGTASRPLKEVFEEACREAAALARCDTPEPLGICRPKSSSS